jgi:hypothetical protein
MLMALSRVRREFNAVSIIDRQTGLSAHVEHKGNLDTTNPTEGLQSAALAIMTTTVRGG